MANVKLTDEIRDILNRSTITENSLILPPGQLDRATYEAVNKALVAAGGKWNRSAKAHLFSGDPRVKLGLAMETGVVVDEKKLLQAFFTPEDLAMKVARMADVEGKTVLEPSAGEGALVNACRRLGASDVDCVEISQEYVEKLRTLAANIGKIYVRCDDFLTCSQTLVSGKTDVLLKYDRIVMNPPFTKDQDVRHVSHAMNFLNDDGILVAIMWPNKTRKCFVELLQRLDQAGYQYEIEDVPAGTFKESGTAIATMILTVKAK
jgi:predicted RNA methylase